MDDGSRKMSQPTSLTPPVAPGDVLGEKYRVEAEIGAGGMGLVVSARHIAMGHRLAIKILRLDNVNEADSRDAVSRFFREARAAARIESEHVVRVIDVAALADGTPYMVMEYLEGQDLRDLIRERGQLPIEEAVGYALQACEGLAEAHAAGVIHRDLKPGNLFLAKRGNGTTVLKVLDFGISKVAPRPGEVAATTTRSLMGSPLYMAPEQMRSSKNVDERADVWSLGLILFELLAGDTAFEGETIPEVCLAVMNGPPAPITRFRKDVPEGLQGVLLKCIEKEREERYPGMGALARALEPYASAPGRVHAERTSAVLKAERTDRITSATPRIAGRAPPAMETQGGILIDEHRDAPTRRREKQRRRGVRGVWIAAAGASCVGAAIAGALLAQRATPTPSTEPPSPVAASTPPVAPTPPAPVATRDLPSVPVDSLPLARDASAPHAPPPAVRRAPPAAAPAAPAASASASKDDWKWGDRN
jgi:serine/threonine-protein kinase